MLGHLGGEDAPQRPVGLPPQEVQQVALAHVEAAGAAGGRGVRARLDAAGGDALRLQQLQQLAAPAAEVDHRREAFEEGHVGGEPLAQLLGLAAEAALERRVGGIVRGASRRPRHLRRRGARVQRLAHAPYLGRHHLQPVA